jgi:hypothetical protein
LSGRWRLLGLVGVVLVMGVALGQPARPARADGITVQSNTSKNNFPNGLTFSLVASSNANISKVRLRFKILPVAITAFQNAVCNGEKSVTCTAAVGTTRGSYVNPKAQIVYAWEMTDDAGQQLSTAEQTVTYEDSRFGWQSKTDGLITVWYYTGNANSINSIQAAALESVNNISDLLRTQIDFPIKVIVYSTARDLQQALTPGSSQFTAGQVSSADTALTSLDQLGVASGLDTVRHEVAHLVTEKGAREFIAGVPAWLNEGISVYSQKNFDDGWKQTLDQAIKQNRVLSISSLRESARDANATVNLFYGEAGSLVTFLISTNGKQKFAEFFNDQKNMTLDDALKATYGFDQNGLENAWRKSVGLPPSADTSSSGSQTGGAAAVPTIVPFGSNVQPTAVPASGGGSQASKSGGGSNPLVYVIGALVAVLVVTIAGTAGYLGRSKKTSA